MKKQFDLGKATHHILWSSPLLHFKQLRCKYHLNVFSITLYSYTLKERWHCIYQGIEDYDCGTVVDWYKWYLGLNKSGCRHLGAIVNANSLKWYMWFKQNNFGCISNINNFAVFYTPTSIEMGEVVVAKFSFVDFDSSNTSSICLTTSQLVVVLSLYGILLVVYWRGTVGMVVLVQWHSSSTILGTYGSIHSLYVHTNLMCIYVDLLQYADRIRILYFEIRNYESLIFLVNYVNFSAFDQILTVT